MKFLQVTPNWINGQSLSRAWEFPDWLIWELTAFASWNLNELQVSTKTRTTWTTTFTVYKNSVSQWTVTITSATSLTWERYFNTSSWITWSFVAWDTITIYKTDTWSPAWTWIILNFK